MEIWKDIKNFEGLYQVSNFGKIKSLKYNREKIMKLSPDKVGYLVVTLSNKTFKVHRLVCQTFKLNPLNKPEVNHKDGNKSNNNDWNLEWNTSQENHQHAFNHGLRIGMKGERNGMSKLIQNEVNQIRINKENNNQKELAKIFNVSEMTISKIVNNKIW